MRDETLEEMWEVKRRLGSEHKSWDDYVAALFAFQEDERKRGVKFVSFESKRPDHTEPDQSLSVAEGDHPYDGSAPV